MRKILIACLLAITSTLLGITQAAGQNVAQIGLSSSTACADLPIIVFSSAGSVGSNFCWDFGDASTGSTLPNPTYSYNVGGPGTYTVTLTICDDAGCNPSGTVNCNTTDTVITIFALPVASFNQTATSGCTPFEVCFTDNSTPGDTGIANWNWTFGDGGFDNSGTPTPCYTYPPTSNSSPYTVSLEVVDSNGCSDTIVMSNLITNWAVPNADFTVSPNLGGNPIVVSCYPGELVTFTDASTLGDGAILSWDWDFGDGNTGTGNPATNTYNAAGTYIVDLLITDANGCVDSITKTIRVDEFQAGFTAITLEGCGSLIATFMDTTTTSQGTSTWAWDFSYDGVTFNTESSSGPNVGYYYSSPGTYTVAMVSVLTNLSGDTLCSDTAFNTAFISVYDLPNVGFTVDTTVACDHPFTVTFTDTTAGAAIWEWDVDNKPWFPPWDPDTNVQSFPWTYTDTGCYNVTLVVEDTNGCSDTLRIDDLICITKPIAEFIADTIMDISDLQQPLIAEGCIPLKVHFFDLSIYDTTLINDSIVSWYWNFGDTNALGDYYTILGGDSAIPDSTNDCLTYCTYRNPTHIYVDTGSFTVTLAITTSLGCSDTITMSQTAMCLVDNGPCTVDAGMVPFVDFTVSDTVGCHPFSTEFADLSSSFANEWAWDFGDDGTDILQNPPYTYQSDIGFFDVSLIAKFNGCESEMLVKDSLIEVLAPKPVFSFKPFKDSLWTNDEHFCYEDSLLSGGWRVQIRDTSKGPPDVWVWDLGDTNITKAIDTTFYVYYDTLFVDADTAIFPPDTFFFKAGDTITCDTTFEAYYPADMLTFDADTVPPVPTEDTIHITGDLTHWFGMEMDTDIYNTGQTIIIYEYCIIPELDTIVDSTFTIVMSEQHDTTQADTTLFGCNNEIITPFNVETLPSYDIVTPYGLDTLYYIPHDNVIIDTIRTIYFPDTICFTRRDTITDTTSIPNTIIIGGTDTFNIAWSQILIDTTTYIIPADTNFYGIDTVPPDTTMPDTTFVPADTIMSGMCDTLYIPEDTIIDPPDTVITDSLWKAHPFEHTYFTPGTKTIWLYTWKQCPTCPDSLCVDSTSRDIFISKIDADFTINAITGGDTMKCEQPNASFFFEDITTTIYDSFQRIWDFGDGFILVSPTFPLLDIAITGVMHPSVCQPGGSTTGSYKQVNHVYCDPGTYTVKMTIIDMYGCIDSVTHQIIVNPVPAPQIVPDTASGCVGDLILGDLEVTFTDTVSHPYQIDYWVWNYGDGAPNDTTYIPVTQPHTYATCNTFLATLTAVSKMGCKNQIPVVTLIQTTCPTAGFVPTSQSICSGDPLTFITTSSPLPLTHTWDWCDSTAMDVTTANSIQHTFNVDSTKDFRVTLTVNDANGCSDTTSWVITVEQPLANFYGFAADIDTTCPNTFQFEDSSSLDVTSWSWTFGDGNVSNLAPPVQNTYVLPGSYDVCLTVTNASGCTDDTCMLDYIQIRGPILIDTFMIDTGTCSPYPVLFSATGYNTEIFTWFFGDGGDTSITVNADPLNPDTVTVSFVYYYTSGGSFTPILMLQDPADSTGQRCPYQYILPPVNVPGPQIGFYADDTICGPRWVSFIDTSLNTGDIDFYWWDFGDGHSIGPGIGNLPAGTDNDSTTGTFNEPSHFFADTGTFDVTFGAWIINESIPDTCFYLVTKEQYVTVFGINPPYFEGCPPLTVAYDTSGITTSSSLLPYDFNTIVWNFGDGDSAIGPSVSHTYQSTGDSINNTVYDITVTFGPTCSFVAGQAIVFPTPTASFTIDPKVSGISTSVFLTNTSVGADSIYLWDFDDNSPIITSYPNDPNVSHAYIDTGLYNIQLVACNTTGCCDTTENPMHCEIKIPNVFNPGSETAGNAVFYIGDFFLDTLNLNIVTLRLVVFNRWGEVVYRNENYQDCNPFGAPELCWNGEDMKGNQLGTDTYFYVLTLNDQAAVNGYVMLLRPK